MGLLPLSGSDSSISQPSDKTPVTQSDVFAEIQTVKNTMVNRDAYIATDYPQTSLLISAYVEGSALLCTYYHVTSTNGQTRSSITDITALRDNISIPLLKISQFEMKVPQSFSLTWDGAANEASVTGEAVTYPGFNPYVGDHFIYQLTSGQIGIFQIDSVEPLSYHNEHLYRVSFHLRSVSDPELIQLLEDRTVSRRVFDKQVYLASNKTLLTEDSYSINATLKQMRKIVANYVYRTFFSNELGTLMAPDGTYDPYLVKFMNSIISFNDVKQRARQLYPEVDTTYRFTVWDRLLDNYNLGFTDLSSLYIRELKFNTYLDVGVTALSNKAFNLIRPDLDPLTPENWPDGAVGNYIFSAAFYEADVQGMTPFEIIVHTAITTRKIADIPTFITTYVNSYTSEFTESEQFYYLPIVIRLMDLARSSLAPNIR